jgi:PucR C-terminal helix-turn-helix domain/GGDEF-like domain
MARPGGSAQVRAELCERLRGRRAEIEQAVMARVYGIDDPEEVRDPEYVHGLRATAKEAIEYGISVIEHGEERASRVPQPLLDQARLAATCGVQLETVLRRYVAGSALLDDFVMQEARAGGAGDEAVEFAMRAKASVFDRVLGLISREYKQGARMEAFSSELRRVKRVRRLLDGEPVSSTDFSYEFEGSHVGVVAAGREAAEAIRGLASKLGRRLLMVSPEGSQVWAWLGSRRSWDPQDLHTHLDTDSSIAPAAIGEPARGIAGWRLTHRQAKAAMQIAKREGEGCVRYRDVALIASVMRDELLCSSLHQTYLSPLEERSDGVVLRETLLAYLKADRNSSSAAAALGVNRHTVSNRLKAIEESLGRPLHECATELEIALRFSDLEQPGVRAGFAIAH